MSEYRFGGHRRARHYRLDGLEFSLLTEDEVRQLSVAKIYKPFEFDKYGLNYPENGGVYDRHLGPLNDASDPCATCGERFMKCTGHFGHIELPLPVVNPLFHQLLATILKLACRKCFKLQFPRHVKLILFAKKKLFRDGYSSSDVHMFEETINNYMADDEHCFKSMNPIDQAEFISEKIQDYVTNLQNRKKPVISESQENPVFKKKIWNIEFQAHADQVLKNYKPVKVCIYCDRPVPKVTTTGNKIITIKADQSDDCKQSKGQALDLIPILPDQSMEDLQNLWKADKKFLKIIAPVLETVKSHTPTNIFFFKIILVTPPIVRPISKLNEKILEHPRTQVYKLIIQNCLILRKLVEDHQSSKKENEDLDNEEDEDNNKPPRSFFKKSKDSEREEELQRLLSQVKGTTILEKIHNIWQDLQIHVNHILDRDMNKTPDSAICMGLKQIIEKKLGIIRMHMMGKRVNYACRSVITPDPNLDIDEIGIPEAFAMKLTYPVPVTPLNVNEIQKLVLNGPDVFPGATLIQNENGIVTRISGESRAQRESIAKTLLTKTERANKFFDGMKIVHRHLQNGDMLLLNRQPTLHKPSIMAHKARVLKSEKTLRLHYSNCQAYNADFDGDEMNAHFPQNEVARSEAKYLANVANQYLVPKNGTPLGGLIQDHVISGVRLTMRGRFFDKGEYQELIFSALWSVIQGDLMLLPAAILKPKKLWTGKQVISTIIINLIPKGQAKINMTGKSKIESKYWINCQPRIPKCGIPFENPDTMSEFEVIIRSGELLCGVLDKAHYGASSFGLIHCLYELYGGDCSTKVLSAFGKLFQCHLISLGFTLGVEDLLVNLKAEKKRKKVIKKCRKVGEIIQKTVFGLPEGTPREKVAEKVEEKLAADPTFRAQLDAEYKSILSKYTDEINKACLPAGLIKQFPENNLQLMVRSGAKGSVVNTTQISCLLGQIELEGKRPPLMISGRSLPCFPPFDLSPRAGGFIDGRFMTGIEPPEFFFHCMAGREGLIDTAVKTSRSGYLQRCLVKHLEGLSVQYDLTVRDSDARVIQFAYGEDGLDVGNAQFLNADQLNFLVENKDAIINEDRHHETDSYSKKISKHEKKLAEWEKKNGFALQKRRTSPFAAFSADYGNRQSRKMLKIDPNCGRSKASIWLMKKWHRSDEKVKKEYERKAGRCPDPLTSIYGHGKFGVFSERLNRVIDDYLKKNVNRCTIDKDDLKDLVALKVNKSLAQPGEAVGAMAAQSIGEPSTQMTLNTFHFAGRGEMNVTLGIPRMREILMMASKNIKTPFMEIPFKEYPDIEKKLEQICKKLARCVLPDVLEDVDVSEKIVYKPIRQRLYKIRLNFLPKKLYKHEFNITPSKILERTESHFFKEMFKGIKKAATSTGVFIDVGEKAMKEKDKNARLDAGFDDDEPGQENPRGDVGENHESSDEDEIEEDADASSAKSAARHEENQGYDDPEEEDMEVVDDENDENLGGANESLNLKVEKDDSHNSPDLETLQYSDRIRKVKMSNQHIIEYDYDQKNNRWAECSFNLPLHMEKMDFPSVLREAVNKVVLCQTPNIKRAFVTKNSSGARVLKTDGINVSAMYDFSDVLNLDKLYSNDIYGISKTYGIEAANRVIMKEVKEVFKVYGISVDSRHLSLIADYMTFDGTYQPMNRKGMENASSPLQQMTFESSLQFLKKSVIQGKYDDLKSPSARLMVGLPCRVGTGAFDVRFDYSKMLQIQQSNSINQKHF